MNRIHEIELKLNDKTPLNFEDGLWLYEKADLDWLKERAQQFKKEQFGSAVYYNRNVHFEPTNICVYSCKFCAFYRKPKSTEADGAWDYTLEDLKKLVISHPDISEIHITGGVHPDRGVEYGEEMLRYVHSLNPNLHIKAFTAVEISFFARKSGLTLQETLERLQKAGLQSLPGGGAEIFDPEVRRKIAGGKAPAHTWLDVHATAHKIGLKSNATMLYGHIEKFEHRLKHMMELQKVQAQSNGFMSFIPLRYRNENNALSGLAEAEPSEDLRNFAVSRLFLSQIPHLKAYWVMLGWDVALQSLAYGVDDLDGTIDDTTKIYSMAGGITAPKIHSNQLVDLIKDHGFEPVERNSLYQPI
jgi:aminodeoxyfutalosine synthase